MSDGTYFLSNYEDTLFHGRYQDPGSDEEKTWSQVFRRVANTVAPDAESALRMFDMMNSGSVIPSSPQLWNYGASRRFPRNGSSCFTGRMGDELKEFRQADSDAEDVYVASGGFGLLLNETRPRGTKIRHCSEGAMGSMCMGGPARRIEGTTGYITGSGRARGALMLQLSMYHPDCIEFILAKKPSSLGFLDNWRVNAMSVLDSNVDFSMDIDKRMRAERAIGLFESNFAHIKEWPKPNQVHDAIKDEEAVVLLADHGCLKFQGLNKPVIPQVYDWNLAEWREASRDWELPMQNCNMSVRVPDALMHAVDADDNWVFHWYSSDPPKGDEVPWTRTDALGEGLKDYGDGTVFLTSECMTKVEIKDINDLEDLHYRYGVVITTWEGLLANMKPNQNQWRDTDYARFYRKVIQPSLSKYTGKIKARQVWELINENAWSHADPGVVFEDTYERFQPVDSDVYGPRLSNPCSEYVNSAGGSCNLASVNLRACVEEIDMSEIDIHGIGWSTRGLYSSDHWHILKDTPEFTLYLMNVRRLAKEAIHYISHALEYNEAPIPYIEEMTRHHFRTVGIGMMGLAEALMGFHVQYGSTCAQMFAAATMSEIALSCWEGSFDMHNKHGMAKPLGWNQSNMIDIFSERLSACRRYNGIDAHRNRWRRLVGRVAAGEAATHTCVTSVAPTGSISMIAGWAMTRQYGVNMTVSGGLEPPFSWGVYRQDSSGQDSQYHDLWFKEEHHGKPWMVTANELDAEGHVRMQAAVCAFTCMSVSKTINLPNDATVEDVEKSYRLAWELGIPGTSLYRDGSKPMQVLSALECPSGECGVDWDSIKTSPSVDNGAMGLVNK